MAGKEVDIAMWEDETNKRNGRSVHYLTGCEAEGVRAQFQCTGQTAPDWKRVLSNGIALCCEIKSNNIPTVRAFVRRNMAGTRLERDMERDMKRVVIRADKGSTTATVEIYDFHNRRDCIESMRIELAEPANASFQFTHEAERFHNALLVGFNGTVRCNPADMHAIYYDNTLGVTALCSCGEIPSGECYYRQ